jgi:hypothetical protein
MCGNFDKQHRGVATEGEAVPHGVADERGGRGDAVVLEHVGDQLLALRERFVPRRFAERVALTDQGSSHAVGVLVQVPERRALRHR